VLIIAVFALAWHFLSHSKRATGGDTSSGTSASALAIR
jgi:hypothetical protein